MRILSLLLSALLAAPALAISVSGVVTTTGGSSPAGFRIVVEQVGGELPLFSTNTAANGTWSVSDPLLFGNIRVTASRNGYRLTPAQLDRFTNSNITDANFQAERLVPDLTVSSATGANLTAGATVAFPEEFPGYAKPLALTLRNDGIAPLTGLALSFSGAQAGEFTVLTGPPASLAPGASALISILWTPTDEGPRGATLSIASNDPDENPFTLELSGLALPLALLTVSNTASSGVGSLRAAIANAAAVAGPHRVILAPQLNGSTIRLATQLVIDNARDVTVDAGALPAGLTISGSPSGSGSSGPRHFRVLAGSTLTLVGLNLLDGRGDGENRGGSIVNEGSVSLTRCLLQDNICTHVPQTAGGAIFNAGQLQMRLCTLRGNIANAGAALQNQASAELTDCTLTANGGGFFVLNGGAIVSNGSLRLLRCTLSKNSARTSGGALFLFGETTLSQCTIHDNSATDSSASGGAIAANTGNLTIEHCTITQNRAAFVGGVVQANGGGFTLINRSIIAGNGQDVAGAPVLAAAPNLIRTYVSIAGVQPITPDPLLAPLADYGGPVQTRALLPGSPARDAAGGSPITGDQRGFPIVGLADLGAYEAGTVATNFNAYIWETLPANANVAQRDPAADFDGDGQSNFDEWLALTEAARAGSFFQSTIVPAGADLAVDFRSATGRRYQLQQSDSLATGTFAPAPAQPMLNGDGSVQRLNVPRSGPRQFFRVVAMP